MSTTIVDNLKVIGSSPNLAEAFLRISGGLDGNSKARAFKTSFDGSQYFRPSGSAASSFARMRTADPQGLFDSKQIYAKDDFWMRESLGAGATSVHSTDTASVTLTVPVTSGIAAIRQSRNYIPYQPGRAQLIFITGAMGAGIANVAKRMGYFDDNNGLFFEQLLGGISVVVRTHTSGSSVDTAVAQASWNLDTLDGNGRSGVNIDFTKGHAFVIDFGWLGYGLIRFGLMFGGDIIYCHQIEGSNSVVFPFMTTPSLPIRYEIRNTGVSAGATLIQTCCAAVSDGGVDTFGTPVVASNGATIRTVPASDPGLPLISLRLRAGFERAIIQPAQVGLYVDTADSIYYTLWVAPNGSVTGGAYSSLGQGCEVNITGTTFSTTNAVLVGAGYFNNILGSILDTVKGVVRAGASISGSAEELVLAARSITSTANVGGTIVAREIL